MAQHFWIIEVNGPNEQWAWRAHGESTPTGMVIRAYRSQPEAQNDLGLAQAIYGKARLRKYVSAAAKEGQS